MKTVALIVTSFLLLSTGAFHFQAQVKNPDTFILTTYGTLRALDPAAYYDATGSGISTNGWLKDRV